MEAPPEQDLPRLVHHTPLRRWSPLSPEQFQQLDRFRDRVLRFPFVTAVLTALCVWFYLVQLVFGFPVVVLLPGLDAGVSEGLAGLSPAIASVFAGDTLERELMTEAIGFAMGWLSAPAVDRGEWFRLLSAAFLHGSILHIAGNALVLWFLGRTVENLYGKRVLLSVFVLSAIGGAALSVTATRGSSLGASGGIVGLLGLLVGFGLLHKRRIPIPLVPAFTIDSWFFVLFVGILSAIPGVDWAGHLGGFLAGLLLGLSIPPQDGAWLLPADARPRAGAEVARSVLAAGAALLVIGTLTVMGTRILRVARWVPAQDIRALSHAVERGDAEYVDRYSQALADRLPDSAEFQLLRVAALSSAGRWDEAIAALDKVPGIEDETMLDLRASVYLQGSAWQRAVHVLRQQERLRGWEFRQRGNGDNSLAWALLRGSPRDKKRVQEALTRVRRALQKEPEQHAYRNTLAYALLLSGDAAASEKLLRELMLGGRPEEVRDDVFMHILALLALRRDQEAKAAWDAASARYPSGELRDEAETKLRAQGLLPAASPPAEVGAAASEAP